MKKQSTLRQSAFRMNRVAQAARALAVLAGMAAPGLALAQMSFPSAPPLARSSSGALPNIILAIDNSSSMIYNTDVTFNGKTMTRMEALISAIKTSFGDASMTGKFRLAYESMFYDAGFGENRYFKSKYDNSMRLFDSDYQANFIDWVTTLGDHTGSGNNAQWAHVGPQTPSQWMIIYAGEYLKGKVLAPNDAGKLTCSQDWCNNLASTPLLDFMPVDPEKSPWNATQASTAPPVEDASPLSCRRAYFIFMTDGLWTYNPLVGRDPSINPPSTPYMPYVADISGNAEDQNYDGAPHTLGDGNTQYDPAQTYGRLYADATNFGKNPWNAASNMADWSFYYWANDLQTDIDNQVAPQITVIGDQTFTSGTASATYPQYWNPKNDPATWQHMNTYTIGFGGSDWTSGKNWPYSLPSAGAGIIKAYNGKDYNGGIDPNNSTQTTSTDYSCGIAVPAFDSIYGSFFSAYASGAMAWPACTGVNASPDNLLDVVHAAYNGRGKYYPATTQEALTSAFQDILQTAIAQSAPSGALASAAASSSRLTGGAVAYAAGYTYDGAKAGNYDTAANAWGGGTIDGWSGSLTAYDGASVPAGVLWTASVPAAAARNILTANSSGHGIAFEFGAPNLTAADNISGPNVATARANPLGDIVNSQLAYVGSATRLSMDAQYVNFAAFTQTRRGMVYVGANDGMLHGFDAGNGTAGNPGTGAERMAYIPRGLVGKLHLFSEPGAYAHNYWVDGSAFSGDAQLLNSGLGVSGNTGKWGTALVGALGAGGKGYFVLDVSNPASLTEGNAGAAVLVDATGPQALDANPAIGYQFSPPVVDMYTVNQSAQIVKLNTTDANGEWGVIMGNGYNSAGGLPVLLIQSLSAPGMPLYTVPASCTAATPAACMAAGNGLGAPRPVDVDGNGTADIVYAGDLLGNLWKFDISSPTRANWKVALGGSPLFKAVGPAGAAQPITSAPAVVPDAQRGGFIVAFGTGKNLVSCDQSDANLNSVYALYDHQPMHAATLPASTTGYIQLDNGSPINCLTGAGAARYGCLYMQNGGAMDTGAQHGTVTSNTTSTLTDQTFDGSDGSESGWYFDIPDVDNGNAAKVLLNPTVLSGNTLMLYSSNVASSSGGGAGPAAGAESCGATALNGALTTVNYFDLLTGNAPDNTFIVGGVTFDPENNPGNRFRIEGAQTYIQNGSDTLQGIEQDASVKSVAPIRAGQRAGWRISR